MLCRRFLIVALAFMMTAGCKVGDRRADVDGMPGGAGTKGRLPAEFSSRPQDIRELREAEEKKGHWVEGPYATRLPRGNAPPADSHVDPRDPNFDTKTETRGIIAGFVVDPDGRKAGKVFVQVEPLPAEANSGAPLEVETLADGSFLMKGLQAGKSYQLTTRAPQGDRILAGRTYARAPNTNVRLSLIEGLTLDDTKASAGTLRKGNIGPSGASNSETSPRAPLPPPNLSPSPVTLPPEREIAPAGGAGDLPPTTDWSPTAPRAEVRPDLTTNGPPGEWKPPVTTIPSPEPGKTNLPPALVPLPSPPRNRSQLVRPAADTTAQEPGPSTKPGNRFTLVDSQGRSRSFPAGNDGDLLLVDFMTTSCVPCQRALPTLVEIQRKYGARGLDVVAVNCDDEPFNTRLGVAEKYRSDHALNYNVYTEGGRKPGELMRKFGVDRFPTVVLIDSAGAVIWQGHPGKKDQLLAAIEDQLGKSAR